MGSPALAVVGYREDSELDGASHVTCDVLQARSRGGLVLAPHVCVMPLVAILKDGPCVYA